MNEWHRELVLVQSCQNVPAAGNFAAFSQILAAYSTLHFTRCPLAGKARDLAFAASYSVYAAYCYKTF